MLEEAPIRLTLEIHALVTLRLLKHALPVAALDNYPKLPASTKFDHVW